MGLIKNAINFGNGFNIGAMGPIDARMRVQFYSDLTTAWNASTPAYLGMIVAVMETNDVYILTDADNWNLESSWSKLAKDSDVKGDASALQQSFDAHVSANTESFKEVNTKINNVETYAKTVSGVVSGVTAKLNGIAENETVSGLISAEVTNRTSEITRVEGLISAETTARTAADNELRQAIADAESAAKAAATKFEIKEGEQLLDLSTEELEGGAVKYILSTTSGVATVNYVDEAIEDVNNSITNVSSSLGGRVNDIETNYATKAELQAETERATTKENQIESALTAVTARVEAFLDNTDLANEALDSLIELKEYIESDSAHTQNFIQGIADNKRDIALVSSKTINDRTELEGLISTEINKVTTALTATEGRLDSRIQKVETGLTSLTTQVQNLDDSFTQEKQSREEADSNLNNLISAETTARTSEITRVEGLVSAEATARETAISAEATARETAISAEATARETADTQLDNRITELTQNVIDNERTIAESLNNLNVNKLSVEEFSKHEKESTDKINSSIDRISVLENVRLTGSNAIVINNSSATSNKEVSLKLSNKEINGGVSLHQDGNGLSAIMQWGEF